MNRTRFSGIFNASMLDVSLIGCGGIGGFAALNLAKMGVDPLILVDGDRVAEENTGSQIYGDEHIGNPKAYALRDIVYLLSPDTAVASYQGMVPSDIPWQMFAASLVISAVDSINSRQAIWGEIRTKDWVDYIDARMGPEFFMAYVVKGDDRQWYDDMLANEKDDLYPDEPCTAKATFYTGSIAGGIIGSIVRDILTRRTLEKVLTFDIGARVVTRVV